MVFTRKRRFIQTKVYYKLFYSVWKETSHKPLKVGAAKKFFSSVHIINTTCSNHYAPTNVFFPHVITGRHYFYTDLSFLVYNRHATAFLETSVLKEVRILHPLPPRQHNNAAHTKRSKIKLLLLKCSQQNLFAHSLFYFFSLWMFHFFLINEIFI